MTTQIDDMLFHDGASYRVRGFPLANLGESWCSLARDDGTLGSRFGGGTNTACRRKYVATWTVDGGRLYLTGFNAVDLDGNALCVEDVFGTDRLFAFWYTGKLSSPFGDRIRGMFDPVYQFDHLWRFQHGSLLDRTIRHNNIAPDSDRFSRHY